MGGGGGRVRLHLQYLSSFWLSYGAPWYEPRSRSNKSRTHQRVPVRKVTMQQTSDHRHDEPLFFQYSTVNQMPHPSLTVCFWRTILVHLKTFETWELSRKKITFLFKFTSIICSFSFFKMYLEMNMSKYSSAKYSQVEDKAEFEENPAGRAAQARNRPIPPPRNLKWTSLRQPRNNQQGEIV